MNAPASMEGTAILVWSAGLETPERLATLFLTAQACAAMDMKVELYFTATSVRLLQASESARLVGYGPSPQSLRHYLADSASAGVQLLACAQALHHLGLSRADLVNECNGTGGVVQFAARCASPAWRALVF